MSECNKVQLIIVVETKVLLTDSHKIVYLLELEWKRNDNDVDDDKQI